MMVQRWRPTKAEAELLVDMTTARLAPAKIAATLGIDLSVLRDYVHRLSAAARAPWPDTPLPLPPRPSPDVPRVLAARLFSRDRPA
jgi:hypothetical protein